VKLDAAAIVLRPRSVAEVMDLACRLMAVHLGLYLRVAAAVLVPCFGLCLAARYALGWGWPETWILAATLAAVAQGAFTALVGRLLFAETLTAREVLSAFRKRLASYLGALIFTRIALALSALLVVTLPMLWTRILFVHEASVLEGATPVDAASRSSRFIKGRGSVAFQTWLLLLCAQGAFIIGAELLGDGIVDGVLQLGEPFGALLDEGGTPFSLFGFFASVAYVSTARFLEYIDMRTRADGWDIQVRFMEIAAREGAPDQVGGSTSPRRKAA
jgi:hypothetical protein